jgi:hypothetical protein
LICDFRAVNRHVPRRGYLDPHSIAAYDGVDPDANSRIPRIADPNFFADPPCDDQHVDLRVRLPRHINPAAPRCS